MKKYFFLLVFINIVFISSCKKNPTSPKNTAPVASFTVNPTEGTTDTTFDFDASGSTDNEDDTSLLEIIWDWTNDGTWDTNYSTTKTTTHKYATEGTYTIKLEVKDSGDLSHYITKTVIVSTANTAPVASFTITPTEGTTDTTFDFDASGSTDNEDDTSVLEVRWDWENDGNWDTNYSAEKTATHNYATEGTFTIKMGVKDTGGLNHSITKTVNISPGNTGTVTDIDGNVYKTIKIGDQWWMVENLKVTHYRNGYPIPNVTNNTEWDNYGNGAYCSHNNNDGNVSTYGRLYNWDAVNDSKGLAPDGWHIPSDEEWDTLINYLGGANIAGGKMKETGTAHWESPNTGATNESGFTALPGSYRRNNGSFPLIGYSANFWSSTKNGSYSAWYIAT